MIRRLTIFVAVLLLVPLPSVASGASLYFSPSSRTTSAGGTVSFTLKVNGGGQAINASEGTIVFPTGKLRLNSISTSGSIFSFWAVQPSGSNSTGRIVYSGGLPSPGFKGSSGTILTATFATLTSGSADISISGAKVLANDGNGTDVLSSVSTANVTISTATSTPSTPTNPRTPSISSPTYPDQSAWYVDNQATIRWTAPSGVTGYSFRLSQNSSDTPDHQVDSTGTSTAVTLSQDGIWYFTLQANSSSGWSDTARFRLQHDTVAPQSFTITVERERGTGDPTPQLVFSTTDATSGVAKYTLALDGAAATDVTSPATLSDLSTGTHTAIITAVDKAGNTTSSQVSIDQIGYPAPTITDVTSPLLLLDRLVVKGTANAGDTVTVFVDGQSIGEVVAGSADTTNSGVTVRTSWILTSDHIFRPGQHKVTAQATSVGGAQSVVTDPQPLIVSGHFLLLGGQPVATIAIAPLMSILLLVLVGLITFTFVRLFMSLKRMHDREVLAEEELEDLRRKVRRNQVSNDDLDESLATIERDLERPVRKPRARRQSRRR